MKRNGWLVILVGEGNKKKKKKKEGNEKVT